MSLVFYSFRYNIENRSMFNNITICGLDNIFNKKHSQELIDYLENCSTSIVLKNFNPNVNYKMSIMVSSIILLHNNNVVPLYHIFSNISFFFYMI